MFVASTLNVSSLSELCVASAPHGFILNPMIVLLSTPIIKYADDITIIGLMSLNDALYYAAEVEHVEDNYVVLETSKTCELVVDFSRSKNDVAAVICDSEVHRNVSGCDSQSFK